MIGNHDAISSDAATMLKQGGDGDPAGDGAYWKTPGPNRGTIYVVSGSSSRFEGTITPWPALAVGLSELGSLVVDLVRNQMDVRLIRPDATVADHFRLIHLLPLFADGFESGNTSAWS